MAIGVKLHPDHMTREDWEALPGIGSRLAEKIEENRQKNGDFGALDDLKRVRGVGSKSIERWRCFFEGG
jgi:competence protein ComEA